MFFKLAELAIIFIAPLALSVVYILRQRRRKKFALRYASVDLVRSTQTGRGWRRHIPPLLFVACLVVLILSIMQPTVMVMEPSDEAIVIVTLDTSASMWANDLYPNRMEAAKDAAQLFVDGLPPKMRIGVVSFSEASYLNQAPTTNRTLIKKAIDKLQPRSGTAIGHGLTTSLDALYGGMGGELPMADDGMYAPAIIVLLTDGENTDGPSPLEVIGQASDRGIRVYTIGIGSPKSTTVQVGSSALRAKLDEGILKEMARLTDAQYYNASTEKDLRAVYQTLTTQLITRLQPLDLSFIFITGSFFLGVLALAFSLIWSSRLP